MYKLGNHPASNSGKESMGPSDTTTAGKRMKNLYERAHALYKDKVGKNLIHRSSDVERLVQPNWRSPSRKTRKQLRNRLRCQLRALG